MLVDPILTMTTTHKFPALHVGAVVVVVRVVEAVVHRIHHGWGCGHLCKIYIRMLVESILTPVEPISPQSENSILDTTWQNAMVKIHPVPNFRNVHNTYSNLLNVEDEFFKQVIDRVGPDIRQCLIIQP